jgi:cytochrome c-type biogenesis protein
MSGPLLLPVDSIGTWFHQTALSGSLVLAVPVALVAGAVSFFSPCVLPLLPGYLSYMTGLSGADIVASDTSVRRGRMLAGSLLFIIGFSVPFVAIGGAFGQLGYELVDHQLALTRILGVVVVVLGLVFLGMLPLLQRDVRIHTVPWVGLGAAPLLGLLFGLGWTPCIGPTLAAVLSLSATGSSADRGAFLTFVYCLGLGIPFVIAAVSFRHFMGTVSFVRRHQVWVMRLGGLMLVTVGVLLLTGTWATMIAWMQTRMGTVVTPV